MSSFFPFAVSLPLLAHAVLATAAPACTARSGATVPTVVELYTSEGCSSCPPADRWLSGLPRTPQVLALAFHVDYWDSLGWQDRYASPAYSQRQRQWQTALGTRFVYTPQILANGRDWRGLPGRPPEPAAQAATAAPVIELSRDGAQLSVDIRPAATPAAADTRYSGYWAVVEDGQQSAVKAGENRGALLHHDHVVRQYLPLPSWPAASAQHFTWTPEPRPAGQTGPRQVVFVAELAATRAPVQALALSCPGL